MKTKTEEPIFAIQEWEYVHNLFLNGKESESVEGLMKRFLIEANPKLQKATGGIVPEVPKSFLEKCIHLARYNLLFDPKTGQVVFVQ